MSYFNMNCTSKRCMLRHAELQAEIVIGAADCAGDLSQGHVSLDVE